MAIVLYGATGYTGRLVTSELVRRGLPFALSGRNAAKLQTLSEELGQGAPVRPAATDDPAALRTAFEDADVVINCAGPFTLHSEPVVRAAVETRSHYVDSTGEQPFIRMVFERYGPEAERRGVALVPALGFDYAPGDCAARIAADGHEPVDELTVAYAVKGFGMTRGTMRSALEMLKEGEIEVFRESFEFPPPIGRQPMGPYPAGEVVTVPSHTDVRRVNTMLTLRSVAPHRAAVRALPYTMPAFTLALRTPLRHALSRAIGRLPEGPSEEDRRAARFTIVAVARGAGGSEGRCVVRGSDVYGLTAVTLVHGAELMSAPGFDRTGALGPAGAYDPRAFLGYLQDHGVSWESPAGGRPAARSASASEP